ncbi:enoyl-CoA hydratase-related protein [Saccharopolyspora sp. TS4A08]|uniref:Enoyl-CoA hydratase-related protein n=1 Tax=Saccharopolyspora ipomoeae TaxID=3042027 RepID=A0ABT6PR94_9PSEU|nr:enoyl-CoA hydratase-related protein [Saccharopolyspora sp. TS4A08]MDI2030531.1 enoyl-CoA hydratase-related protein [Saccharopolyspora sp. TS4A08]
MTEELFVDRQRGAGFMRGSSSEGAPVTVEVRDSIAHVVMRRGERGNPIDLVMACALLDAARVCRRANPRVVLLRGEGHSFCVGGDLRDFSSVDVENRRDHLISVTDALHDALRIFASMEAPLITAVHGSVAGAGVGLAAAADLTIASADAVFRLAYTRIGYSPDAGVTWWLPRLVGPKRATELLLTNPRITADEAAAMGLITRVTDGETLIDEAEQLADQLSHGATGAFGATKHLVAQGLCSGLDAQLDRESRSLAAAAASPEGIEGVAAFLAKRSPRFPHPTEG